MIFKFYNMKFKPKVGLRCDESKISVETQMNQHSFMLYIKNKL